MPDQKKIDEILELNEKLWDQNQELFRQNQELFKRNQELTQGCPDYIWTGPAEGRIVITAKS